MAVIHETSSAYFRNGTPVTELWAKAGELPLSIETENLRQDRKLAGELPVHLCNVWRKFAASLNPTSSDMSSMHNLVERRYSFARLQRTSSRICVNETLSAWSLRCSVRTVVASRSATISIVGECPGVDAMTW